MTSSVTPPVTGTPATLPGGITVLDCLASGTDKLQSLHDNTTASQDSSQCTSEGSESRAIGRLEAEVLLAFVLKKSHSWLYTWPEKKLTAQDATRYQQLLSERGNGKPVAYLTGYQEFWSMKFKVSPAVLIPRPDTELLVEIALDFLSGQERPKPRVLELGTGSGAIAIALASELPHAEFTATDLSTAALEIAQENAEQLLKDKQAKITFLESDWFAQLAPPSEHCFQLIVSNPPYIRADDPHLLQPLSSISFEPHTALVAKDHGLHALQHIIDGAKPFLAAGALLALEHGHDQAEDVRELFNRAGYLSIETRRDLAGVERVTLGRHHNVKL